MSGEHLESPNSGWQLNMLRMRSLNGLLRDLDRLEMDGLPDRQCNAVKKLLEEFGQLFRDPLEISPATKHLRHVTKQLRDAYARWNDHDGPNADLKRRSDRLEIKKYVKRIRRKIRKEQSTLGPQLSEDLVEQTFETFVSVGRAHGEYFPVLHHYVRTVERSRRRGERKQ